MPFSLESVQKMSSFFSVHRFGYLKCLLGWTKGVDGGRDAPIFEYGHRILCFVQGKPPSPQHTQVLHSCNNPQCLNPLHLSWGTAAGNANDREALVDRKSKRQRV